MANDKTVISIEIDGVEKSINSIKELREELKAAQSAALNGDGNAAKRVAELKDKMDDLKDTTKSLQGSGVEKISSSFSLLGQGLQDFDTDKIKTGFKGIGSAMSAIPIFLLIEGIKLLWDNFDKVKEVVEKLIPALKETVSIKNELNNASLEGAKNAAIEKNNLDNLYKASTDQTKSIDERKKAQIALQDTYPLTFKNFSDEDFALGKAKKGYDELSKSILDSSMLKAKQSLLDKEAIAFAEGEQERLNKITEAKEKLTTASKKQNVSIDSETHSRQVLASDYEVQKEKIDDLIKANLAEAASFKKKNADILGDLAQHQEGSNKLDAERAAAKVKANEKEHVITEADNTVKREQYKKHLEKLAEIKRQNDADQKTIDDQVAKNKISIEKAATDELKVSKINDAEIIGQELMGIDDKYNQIIKEKSRKFDDDEIAAKKKKNSDIAQASFALAKTSLESTQALSDIFFANKLSKAKKGSAEETAIAKKQFEVNKALQIAQAVMQGAQAVLAAYASGSAIPIIGAVAGPLYAVAAGLVAIKNIQTIKNAQFGGGASAAPDTSGGNVSIPSSNGTPNIAPPTSQQPSTTFTGNKNDNYQPVKTFVTETDIRHSSKRIDTLQSQATY